MAFACSNLQRLASPEAQACLYFEKHPRLVTVYHTKGDNKCLIASLLGGIIWGSTIRGVKGDARSLDYSSYCPAVAKCGLYPVRTVSSFGFKARNLQTRKKSVMYSLP